jgi:hypothetical protein
MKDVFIEAILVIVGRSTLLGMSSVLAGRLPPRSPRGASTPAPLADCLTHVEDLGVSRYLSRLQVGQGSPYLVKIY